MQRFILMLPVILITIVRRQVPFFNQASVKMQAFIGVMKMNIVKVMVVLPVVPRNVLRPVSMENIN